MNNRLNLIMDRDAANELRLWACRGDGKGCRRNSFRSIKRACENCLGPLPENMTLAEVQKQLERADA
jgi:hypothetical protein